MAETKRGERMVSIFIHLMSHPKRSFSATELMQVLDIPKKELRNVQRDMQALVELPGHYVIAENAMKTRTYRAGLSNLDKLSLPDFESNILQFVFLDRIKNIYPGTADLIASLLDRIRKNLPAAKVQKVDVLFQELKSRVVFMGNLPTVDEVEKDKLEVILDSIRTHHEIETDYEASRGGREVRKRIPLMIVLCHNEIYVGCARHGNPETVYAIKLNRIYKVCKCPEVFVENPRSLNALRKKVRDYSLLDSAAEPELIELSFPKDSRMFIEENPFHHSLKIERRRYDLRVTMKVSPSFQLMQWIFFHLSNGVKVLNPPCLRQRLLEFGENLAKTYRLDFTSKKSKKPKD